MSDFANMSNSQAKSDHKSSESSVDRYLTHFQRKLLQKSLQDDLPELYRQRIQIMLLVDEGKSQTEICQTLDCCAATVRLWTYIARAGMAHKWQDCPIGRPRVVNEKYLERLQELVSHNPSDYGYSFRRWTVSWLQKHLAKEFGVEVSDRHIKRLLKQMGLSTVLKPNNTCETVKENGEQPKILIGELKSENLLENTGFLSINFTKLGKNSDIYGAKSVRSVSFSTAVQQYFGVFSS